MSFSCFRNSGCFFSFFSIIYFMGNCQRLQMPYCPAHIMLYFDFTYWTNDDDDGDLVLSCTTIVCSRHTYG